MVMEALEKVLDPDEKIIWTNSRSYFYSYPDTKKHWKKFCIILIAVSLLVIGIVLGLKFHLIPDSLWYIYYFGIFGAFTLAYLLAWGAQFISDKQTYLERRKKYSEEQLRDFLYIDALTNKNFIQRIPQDDRIQFSPEELELLNPISEFRDDFIKLDLNKLRIIKISRKYGLYANLDFNQGSEIDVDTLKSLKNNTKYLTFSIVV